ncbi:MAG: hypothetical protein JXN64_06655 [Spirochaetes bacterium]|nr:hypothetical protein [Spirochaetota bacterium]
MYIEKTVFELVMLICFGVSWPFAIARTLKTKNVKGLSTTFYFFLVVGYISGIAHKILYSMDYVIYLYAINAIMVSFQIFLVFHYRERE